MAESPQISIIHSLEISVRVTSDLLDMYSYIFETKNIEPPTLSTSLPNLPQFRKDYPPKFSRLYPISFKFRISKLALSSLHMRLNIKNRQITYQSSIYLLLSNSQQYCNHDFDDICLILCFFLIFSLFQYFLLGFSEQIRSNNVFSPWKYGNFCWI